MLLCFFFNDTATTEIYTLSLHDALPICSGSASVPESSDRAVERGGHAGHLVDRRLRVVHCARRGAGGGGDRVDVLGDLAGDRKSTRLNSSHANISYAVFCLKKKTTYMVS